LSHLILEEAQNVGGKFVFYACSWSTLYKFIAHCSCEGMPSHKAFYHVHLSSILFVATILKEQISENDSLLRSNV